MTVERAWEFTRREDGELILAVQPPLAGSPIAARRAGLGVEIMDGEGAWRAFAAAEDLAGALQRAERVILVESGEGELRETFLDLDPD